MSLEEQPTLEPEVAAKPAVDVAMNDGAVTDAPADVETEDSESSVESPVDLELLEALLFGTHSPLTPARLAELMGLASVKPIRKSIKELNEQYEKTGRVFR